MTVQRVLGTFAGFDYATKNKPHVRQFNFVVDAEGGKIILDPHEHDAYLWINSATKLEDLNMSDEMRECVQRARNLLK